MAKIDIFSFGWMYEVILAAMFIVFVTDTIGVISSIKGGRESLKEYAELCVKYLKLLMQTFAGVYFLIVAFTYGYDFVTSAIHAVLGVLMLIDAAAGLIIKIRFGRRFK